MSGRIRADLVSVLRSWLRRLRDHVADVDAGCAHDGTVPFCLRCAVVFCRPL